jgi:hypothetical protein
VFQQAEVNRRIGTYTAAQSSLREKYLLGTAVAATLAGGPATVALAVTTRGAFEAARRAVASSRATLHGAGGLLQSRGDDLSRQVEVLTEVLNAGVSEEPACTTSFSPKTHLTYANSPPCLHNLANLTNNGAEVAYEIQLGIRTHQ